MVFSRAPGGAPTSQGFGPMKRKRATTAHSTESLRAQMSTLTAERRKERRKELRMGSDVLEQVKAAKGWSEYGPWRRRYLFVLY